jgi:hypothetical protein
MHLYTTFFTEQAGSGSVVRQVSEAPGTVWSDPRRRRNGDN